MSTATLELHFINVGQGDSILVVNRDKDELAKKVTEEPDAPADPLDYLPYAIGKEMNLRGTVKKALLIDGGDDEYGGDVVAYLQQHGVLDKDTEGFEDKLEVVISHFHDDHIGGLRSLFKKRIEETITETVKGRARTRLVPRLEPRYRPARVYLTALDSREDPKSDRLRWLRGDINAAAGMPQPTAITLVRPGGVVTTPMMGDQNLTIDLGTGIDNIPIELTAYAASRAVRGRSATHLGRKRPDQNDRSIMFVLQYGSFRAYLGGDLAGNGGAAGGNTEPGTAVPPGTKRFFSVHEDLEGPLNVVLMEQLPATTPNLSVSDGSDGSNLSVSDGSDGSNLSVSDGSDGSSMSVSDGTDGSATHLAKGPKFKVDGHCTVLKANHHGSSSSVDVHTLFTTRPCIAVIPVGIKSRFHNHPTQEVLNRMDSDKTKKWCWCDDQSVVGNTVDNTLQGIYLTELAAQYKKREFKVVLPKAAVVMGDVIVRPTDKSVQEIQKARQFGVKLVVQVYGTGAQTDTDPPRTKLRPVTKKDGTYPIGPFVHECSLH
jgi:glyoxylase-like metal-dependent hydrolase (beta-lactamase superfamily II)